MATTSSKSLFLLGFLVMAGCTAGASREDSRGSISGQVVLEAVPGAQDLSRVQVNLGRGEGGTSVDADGRFDITDLEPDVYTLSVTYVGGLGASATGSAYAPLERRVVLSAGSAVNLGDLRLQLGTGTVSGNVVVVEGERALAEGARVTLRSVSGSSSAPSGVVDAEGRYVVAGVPVGTYRVEAEKDGLAQAAGAGTEGLACGRTVEVTQDGFTVDDGELRVAPTNVALAPGANELAFERGSSWFTLGAQVTVVVTAPFAVLGRAWRDGEPEPPFTPFAPGGYPFTQLAPDAVTRVFLQFRDGCGYESPVRFLDLHHDATPPRIDELVVAGNAAFTRERNIAVRVSVFDALGTEGMELRVATCTGSNAQDAACTSALDAAPFTPWDGQRIIALPDVAGPHMVLAQLRDRVGHVSTVESRGITLDPDGPACTLTLVGRTVDGMEHGSVSATRTVDHRITCLEAPARMALVPGSASPACESLAGSAFSSEGTLTVPPDASGQLVMQGCFWDAAGNLQGPVASNTLLLDQEAPADLVLQVHDGRGWFSSADRAALGMNLPVTVSAMEAGLVEVSLSALFAPSVRGTFSPVSGALTLSLPLPSRDGEHVVHVRITDAAGNTAVTETRIQVDISAPVVTLAASNGSTWLNARSSGSVQLSWTLAALEPGTLSMAFASGDGACPDASAFVPYMNTPTVEVVPPPVDSAAEGQHVVRGCVRDAAGNLSEPALVRFTLDRTPPTSALFDVESAVNGITSTHLVVVRLRVGGSTEPARVVEAFFSATSPDCDSVAWEGAAPDALGELRSTLLLSPGDGDRAAYACLRDEAGNVAGPFTSTTVRVDTTAPAPGTLRLAGGAERANTSTVTLDITGLLEGMEVVLGGDLVLSAGDDGVDAAGNVRATVDLSPGEGLRTVTAFFRDAAGNTSLPFADSITVDTTPPAPGNVIIAGGQARVSTQVIGVAFQDTLADTVRTWEAAGSCGACTCGDALCGGAAAQPFSPTRSFALSSGTGTKTLCWQLCDAAGNASAVGTGSVELTTYVARPRPTVTSVTPPSHVALSQPSYVLDVAGAGLAHDTQALVGNLLVPCTGLSAFSSCSADEPTSCGTTCRLQLPPALMRSAGTYLVRLVTPEPVAGGLGTSAEALAFNVVAPTPIITRVEPRGIIQRVDASGVPVPHAFTASAPLKVWGRQFMDNVSFQLRGTSGQVLVLRDVPGSATGERYAEIALTTAGFQPDAPGNPSQLRASNPAPGGGEAAVAFGINATATPCNAPAGCTHELAPTSAPLPDGRGVQLGVRLPGGTRSGLTVTGATHVGTRDASGRMLTRMPVPASGAAVVMPWGTDTVFVEGRAWDHPRVRVAEGGLRGAGTFTAVTGGAGPGSASPAGIAVGDLDEDGRVDVVLANDDRGDVSVHFGVDGVVASTRVDLPVAPLPRCVAVADLDGDGHQDVLVGHRFEGGVSLRRGHGDGTFEPSVQLAMGTNAEGFGRAVMAADLDRDGHLDVVLQGGNTLRVRLADGVGGFRATWSTGMARDTMAAVLADVDRDGRLDLLAGSNNGVQFMMGNGDGTFTSRGVSTTPAQQLVLADLDHDGAPDIIGVSGSTLAVRRWVGRGLLGYGTDSDVTTYALSSFAGNIAATDADGDGHVDVLVAFPASGGPGGWMVRGPGDGTLDVANPVTLGIGRAQRVALADVNADGVLDVVAGTATNALAVSRADTRAALGRTFTLPGSASSAVTADFNADGVMDMAVGARFQVRVYMGPVGPTSVPLVLGIPGHALDLAVGDFNADGHADLAAAGGADSPLWSTWMGNGSGGFGARTDIAGIARTRRLRAADMDGDGDADLVGAPDNTGTARIFFNAGNGTFGSPLDVPFYGATLGTTLLTQDMDHDGWPDITGGYSNSADTLGVNLARPGGVFEGSLAAVPQRSFSQRAPDLDAMDTNGDGLLDLLAGSTNLTSFATHPGNGNGTWGAFTATVTPRSPVLVDGTDMDGDGAPDVIHTSSDINSIRVSLRDPVTRLLTQSSLEFPTAAGARDVVTGDVDGDGVPDIIQPGDSGTVVRVSAGPGRWHQELVEMPAPSVPVPGTGVVLRVHQAAQQVERASVALRVVSPSRALTGLHVRLVSPRGDQVVLQDPNVPACVAPVTDLDVLVVHWPTVAVCTGASMDVLRGWQGSGHWELHVGNTSGAAISVEDFAITTLGRLAAAQGSGRSLSAPVDLALPTGSTVVRGTTLGHADIAAPSCAAAGGADRAYQFTLDRPSAISAQLTADTDQSMVLLDGPCSAATEYACDADSGGGLNPVIAGVHAAAGTHCLVVGGAVRGSHVLTLRTGGRTCAVAPSISGSLGHGVVRGSTLDNADEHAASCGGAGAPDTTWLFTARMSGPVTVSVQGASTTFPVVLSVRSSCEVDTSELACARTEGGTPASVTFPAVAGQSYAIIVDGVAGASGSYALQLSP